MSEAEVVALVLSRPKPVVRVGNLNLHAVHLYLTDEGFRRYTDAADVVLADGWPVWAALHRADPALDRSYRVGSSDWLFRLLDGNPELRVLAVGASPESSAGAAAAATTRAPRVRWAAFDGFSLEQRDSGPRTTIARELPEADLVLVGMGMGVQERWIEEHQGAMTHGVVANVGGCLDYLSGEQVHTPRWVGRMGLEWLYRLVGNPGRNAHRVFVEPAQLAAVLVREASSRRRRPSG